MSSAHCFNNIQKAIVRFSNGHTERIVHVDVNNHPNFKHNVPNVVHDISIITVNVPAGIPRLELQKRSNDPLIMAVGIDRSLRYNLRDIENKLVKFPAAFSTDCPDTTKIMWVNILRGEARSNQGDSGKS